MVALRHFYNGYERFMKLVSKPGHHFFESWQKFETILSVISPSIFIWLFPLSIRSLSHNTDPIFVWIFIYILPKLTVLCNVHFFFRFGDSFNICVCASNQSLQQWVDSKNLVGLQLVKRPDLPDSAIYLVK